MLAQRTCTSVVLAAALLLLIALPLACWNPFAPDKTREGNGQPPQPPTTPEKLMVRLDYAMNEQDWEEYEALLDGNYWFREPNDVDSLNFEWGKVRDVESVRNIFKVHEFFTFEFQQSRSSTEPGEEYTEGPDAHPDEDWEVFYGPVTMYMLEPDGVTGFRVSQNMTFKLRYDPATELWYIIRWIDDPLGAG